MQFFESWAHHLGPTQFETYAKPYANRAMQYVRDRHPDVPIVYYANGGSRCARTIHAVLRSQLSSLASWQLLARAKGHVVRHDLA